LRCGDSLFGEWIRPVEDELLKRGSLLIKPYVDRAKAATRAMAQIEGLTAPAIAAVRPSAEPFQDVRPRTDHLARLLGLWQPPRWLATQEQPRPRRGVPP